jgi:hypothetical protein
MAELAAEEHETALARAGLAFEVVASPMADRDHYVATRT